MPRDASLGFFIYPRFAELYVRAKSQNIIATTTEITRR
jgi:hypothetical protein